MAYAAGPSCVYCKEKCAAEYNACIAAGTPTEECRSER